MILQAMVTPLKYRTFLQDLWFVKMLQPEMFNMRSQDLVEAYHDAGQLYWGKTTAWLETEQMFSLKSTPYILPRYLVQDIDTLEDWETAELMFQTLINKKKVN